MRYEIHISDVRAFKQCRRKWNWSSPLRHNLEPAIPYLPFFTGRAIHYALDRYYTDAVPFRTTLSAFVAEEVKRMEEATGALWEQEKDKVDEQVELMVSMLDHYELWIANEKGRWSDDKFEFIALETEFTVPLRTPTGRASTRIYLAGRFDGLIVRKDDGTFWIWETKTTRSITELERSLANDEQCGAYIYAAQELFDVPISGVLYNILRKKSPTFPRVLQNGTLSKNKNIDTTAFAYADAIKTVHPDEPMDALILEYGDMLNHLIEKGNTFFARAPVYRTPAEIEELQHNLWITGLEMVRPKTPLYPAPAWFNCSFCHFRAPCLAMNAGADYQFILDNEFRERSVSTEDQLTEEGNGT
jgi:hypothetical protein